jgi:hypothetical protein
MWVIYESLVLNDPNHDEEVFMSSIIDLKTLRDASENAINLARLIRNSLRALYEEAMVLYLEHTL